MAAARVVVAMRKLVFARCGDCGHSAMMRATAACGHCGGVPVPLQPPADVHSGWRCHCRGCVETPC